MGAHRCVFCCWVCRIFCFSVIGMTASDILFSKDFLNFWPENSEGFLSNMQPGVKYHSILADFCCTRSTYCCSPFITPFFWSVTVKGGASVPGGEEDQDVQKHVSVGRVEGTGRNPFTSRLGLRKVYVNLSLPCTGVVGNLWKWKWKFQSGFNSSATQETSMLPFSSLKTLSQYWNVFIYTEKSYQPDIIQSSPVAWQKVWPSRLS